MIPAPESVRQEDWEFEGSLSYATRSCMKKNGEKKHKRTQGEANEIWWWLAMWCKGLGLETE